MKHRLLPFLSLICLLAYPRMPLMLTPPSLGALSERFPPELAAYFPEPGAQAADVLVRLGLIVAEREEIIPLALSCLAGLLLACHVWLWTAATLALLGRRQPFGCGQSLLLGGTSLVGIGFLVLAEPVRTQQASVWPLLPLSGIVALLVHFGCEARRLPEFPCAGRQSGGRAGQWLRWSVRVALDGVFAALFVHVAHFAIEQALPRDLIDPPYARLVGLATPFVTERWLMVSLVPGVLLVSAARRTPAAPLAASRAVAALLLIVVGAGGVLGDWNFGRIFVASFVEPAVLILTVAGTLVWLGRRRPLVTTP